MGFGVQGKADLMVKGDLRRRSSWMGFGVQGKADLMVKGDLVTSPLNDDVSQAEGLPGAGGEGGLVCVARCYQLVQIPVVCWP